MTLVWVPSLSFLNVVSVLDFQFLKALILYPATDLVLFLALNMLAGYILPGEVRTHIESYFPL